MEEGERGEVDVCNRLSEVNQLADSLVLLIISVSLVRLLLIAEPTAYCGIDTPTSFGECNILLEGLNFGANVQ